MKSGGGGGGGLFRAFAIWKVQRKFWLSAAVSPKPDQHWWELTWPKEKNKSSLKDCLKDAPFTRFSTTNTREFSLPLWTMFHLKTQLSASGNSNPFQCALLFYWVKLCCSTVASFYTCNLLEFYISINIVPTPFLLGCMTIFTPTQDTKQRHHKLKH